MSEFAKAASATVDKEVFAYGSIACHDGRIRSYSL